MKNRQQKEARKSRPVRMTDAEWADAIMVGMQQIRVFVTKKAAKIKAAKVGHNVKLRG